MKKLKMILTVALCKLLIFALNLFGFSANNLPGNVCLKIYRTIMQDMQLPALLIFITGTNGKTVSSITLSHILRQKGLSVVNNNEGSNQDSGIISKFLKHATLTGRIKADAAVLEVDEDSTAKLCRKLHPQYLIVTNLYRDSISRNAHPDFVYEKLEQIPGDVTLILNADDMLSCTLGREGNRKIFYGAAKAPGKTDHCENIICDVRVCPNCMMPITYDYIQYHHIGRAHCDHCGYRMPEPQIYADQIDMNKKTYHISDRIRGTDGIQFFPTGNLFEIYNNLAIVSLCLELGYDLKFLTQSLSSVSKAGGRYEEVRVNDTEIISMVGKSQNPISCSQSFSKAKTIDGKKVILIAVNDREYGLHTHHEDTSWFYDTDFEFLIDDEVLQYIAIGPRAYDVALRLVLAGAAPEKILTRFVYDTDVVNMIDYDAVKGGTILYFFEVYFREWSKKLKRALEEEGKRHEKR
ncbi:MAG: MurT ligase domain-containing protein [Anaerofustis sp.]